MPKTTRADDKKRLDPYDPRTGATGNDEPEGKRSSPGSGEELPPAAGCRGRRLKNRSRQGPCHAILEHFRFREAWFGGVRPRGMHTPQWSQDKPWH